MANTRDVIGEQATIDGLVSGTLSNFEEDSASKIRKNAFLFNNSLQTVKISGANFVGISAFNYCAELTSVSLPDITSFYVDTFAGCPKLETLDFASLTSIDRTRGGSSLKGGKLVSLRNVILRSTAAQKAVTLQWGYVDLVSESPFKFKEGAFFVDDDYADAFRAASQISGVYNVFPLSSYPRATCSIADSWEDIIAAENDGTYLTKYALGDTKDFTIDGNVYYAKIVGFDTDDKADGNGKAHISWMFTRALRATVNGEASVDWGSSALRTNLINGVLANMSNRNYIVPVTKNTQSYESSSLHVVTTTDSIWIPSCGEVYGGTGGDSGYANYTDALSDANNKIHYNANIDAANWWLRTAYSGSQLYYTTSSGSSNRDTPNNRSHQVVPGFCT